MERILLVDDDVELTELVTEYLAPEGFEISVRHDGESGLEAARSGHHDLIVLDVMLPRLSGLDVLRRLRSQQNGEEAVRVPVLMLTARGDDVDRIVGLELGADDYLPKPFNPRELTARIRAILRRSSTANAPVESSTREEIFVVGDLEVHPDARRVVLQSAANDATPDQTLELTSVEFDLLWRLLRSPRAAVSRHTLTQEILGRRALPYDRSIDTHVSNLRRKLGAHRNGQERIKSIRGVGYIYVSE